MLKSLMHKGDSQAVLAALWTEGTENSIVLCSAVPSSHSRSVNSEAKQDSLLVEHILSGLFRQDSMV